MAVLEALVHILRRRPPVAAPGDGMVLCGAERRRSGIRHWIQDYRIDEQKRAEPARMAARGLHDRVTAHGVADADDVLQFEGIDERGGIGAELGPVVRSLLAGATVTALIDRDDVPVCAQRADHAVPAPGMEPGGVQHQDGGSRPPSPLEVREFDAANGGAALLHQVAMGCRRP